MEVLKVLKYMLKTRLEKSKMLNWNVDQWDLL